MKFLLSIAIIVFVGLPLTSFEKKIEDTNSSNELITLVVENVPLEGMVCRNVTTSCGGNSSSSNRACVNYEGSDARAGANFLAQSIASQMGVAACKARAKITSATAEIGTKN